MKQRKKVELQKMAKNMAAYLKENPKASLFPIFMPSEEYDYLVKCFEKAN